MVALSPTPATPPPRFKRQPTVTDAEREELERKHELQAASQSNVLKGQRVEQLREAKEERREMEARERAQAKAQAAALAAAEERRQQEEAQAARDEYNRRAEILRARANNPNDPFGTNEEDFEVAMRQNAAEFDAHDLDRNRVLNFKEFCALVRSAQLPHDLFILFSRLYSPLHAHRCASARWASDGGVLEAKCSTPASPADKRFSRRQGLLRGREQGGKDTFELQDSDVVCLRSAAADADGYHSLIRTGGGAYHMPPFAVTLEKVEVPGECGVSRCSGWPFTVRVSFKRTKRS